MSFETADQLGTILIACLPACLILVLECQQSKITSKLPGLKKD
jgi:hypothetical protein